jgi:protein tyrosine phosphatase
MTLFFSKNYTEHRVTHYYYTGWPDFNVVEPNKLLELIETINKHEQMPRIGCKKPTDCLLVPMVVHCRSEI